MSIIGLEGVVYGVEDLDLGRRFFTEWGLMPDDGAKPSLFCALDGTGVLLCSKDRDTLPPAIEPGSTAREIIWGVESQSDLEDYARRIEAKVPVSRGDVGTVHFTDPSGMAVVLMVTQRRALPALDIATNTPEQRVRLDTPGAVYRRAAPRRLGHVVMLVPELAPVEEFYRETLGFWLSDRYPGRGVFLRGRAVADHHQLFLLKSPDTGAHFHHLAFEVHDVHEVFGGGLAFAERGWETHIGPGRHVISSSYFWYFKNPCGGAVEYFADVDWLTEAWQPREMPQEPQWFAEWALASGIRQFGGVQR